MDQPRAIYSGAQADPGKVLDKLAAADVDGYLLSLSTARHFESHLAGRAVVVSVSQDHQGAQQVVEQAVAFGASALKYEVYPYTEAESATMRGLEALAVHADRWGLPIMAEVVPGGFDEVSLHTATNLRDSVRRAAEAGADIAKIPPPSEGSLAEVTEYASVPVLLLGGARTGGLQEVLARVRQLGAPSTAWCSVAMWSRTPSRRRSSPLFGRPWPRSSEWRGAGRAARPGRLQTCTKLGRGSGPPVAPCSASS